MDEKLFGRVGNILNKIFVFLICIAMTSMVVLVFCNAVLRYGFQSSIPESEELARYFFIWTCFLGIVAAYARNQHVGVTILSDRLRGVPRALLTIAATILQGAAFYIMCTGGIEYLDIIGDAKGQATGIPEVYVASSIIFAAVVMMGILIFRLYRFCFLQNTQKGDL